MAMGKIDSVVFDEGALICALALDLRFLANKADEDGDDIKTEEVPLTDPLTLPDVDFWVLMETNALIVSINSNKITV